MYYHYMYMYKAWAAKKEKKKKREKPIDDAWHLLWSPLIARFTEISQSAKVFHLAANGFGTKNLLNELQNG